MQNLFGLPEARWTALDTAETGIFQNLDDLAGVEWQLGDYGLSQQDSAALDSSRALIRVQLDQRRALLDTRRATIQSTRDTVAATLISQNAGLADTAVYETVEKAVNAIFLQAIAQDAGFSEAQLEDLEGIAGLCPLADGEAVLQARAMLAFATGRYEAWDDSTACLSVLERGIRAKRPVENRISVYPNPANNEIHIKYQMTWEKPGAFLLYNAFGQVVMQRIFTDKSGMLVLSVANLPAGIYHYTISDGQSGKVSIQH